MGGGGCTHSVSCGAVFATARKSPFVTAAVYLAAAATEFYSNSTGVTGAECDAFRAVARNTLDVARKRFPRDVGALATAADMLCAWGEAAPTIRAFIEAAIEGLPVGDSRPLWDRWIDYELRRAPGGGSIAVVAAIEARRAVAHPHLSSLDARPLLRVAHRAVAPDGDPVPGAVDADLYRRHAYAPWAAMMAQSAATGGVGGGGGPTSAAPSYVSATAAALASLGDAALAAVGSSARATSLRDGVFLQAPAPLPGPLSYIVAPRHAVPAAALRELVDGAPPAAVAAAASAALRMGAGTPATAWTPPPPPPPQLRALLRRLPAIDDADGGGGDADGSPLPPPSEVLRRVCAAVEAADAAASGGSAVVSLSRKRALDDASFPQALKRSAS